MPDQKVNFKRHNGELSEGSCTTIHVRLNPWPPAILFTTPDIADRLEISDPIGHRGGIWRRVSQSLLSSLEAEAEKAGASGNKERQEKVNAVIRMATNTIEMFSGVHIPDSDFVNSAPVDLSCY